MRDLILKRLKYSTRPKFLDLVFERIEGWWMSKVVVHLSNSSSEPICNRDLQAKINDIQEQYFEDDLPIEFLQVK
jgi:DNA-binding HxlR family transcriptional regulator